jgi:RNA polymerase sigma-70 factor (ECF subfamily)
VPFVDEDARTVAEARRGSGPAFRALVERHGEVVHSVLARLVDDRSSIDDLAQETFLRAFEGLDAFRGEARFRTWLIQIAVNLVRDRRRASGRSPVVVSLDELHALSAYEPPAVRRGLRDSPATELDRRELASRLQRAMRTLPHAYREAFVLKHVEGLSYAEISEITGQTVGSLKVRVHRSRTMLREALGDDGRCRDGRLAGALP